MGFNTNFTFLHPIISVMLKILIPMPLVMPGKLSWRTLIRYDSTAVFDNSGQALFDHQQRWLPDEILTFRFSSNGISSYWNGYRRITFTVAK